MTIATITVCNASSDGEASQRLPITSHSQKWLRDFVAAVASRETLPVNQAVGRLKDLIESRTELRMWASAMFLEVPNKVPYNAAEGSFESCVRDYRHMIDLLNVITAEVVPTWAMSVPAWGLTLIGLPFQAIFDWAMGTPSGHAFFLDQEVNKMIKGILDTWRDNLLATSKSLGAITTESGGWLSTEAIAAMEQIANFHDEYRYTFEQLYVCDPCSDPIHWGFRSWDDFFVRRFRNIDAVRPVAHPDNSAWIVNACESRPVAVQEHIKQYDEFWLKGKHYSVADMLGRHPLAQDFVGGTIYQAVLEPTVYHRWHAPVSGYVIFAKTIEGAYFSERSTNGLSSEPILPPYFDQVYLGHVATRTMIFIRADQPVGLLCFVAIGIADVSTCEISPRLMGSWPQRVEKGEEMGMFHYGGSGYCLLFRKDLELAFVEKARPGRGNTSVAIRSPLAFANVRTP